MATGGSDSVACKEGSGKVLEVQTLGRGPGDKAQREKWCVKSACK
jgi:hypothetical protein